MVDIKRWLKGMDENKIKWWAIVQIKMMQIKWDGLKWKMLQTKWDGGSM